MVKEFCEQTDEELKKEYERLYDAIYNAEWWSETDESNLNRIEAELEKRGYIIEEKMGVRFIKEKLLKEIVLEGEKIDPDEEQMKDEATPEWVKGWNKQVFLGNLSIKQKIHLFFHGHVFLRNEGKQEGWNGPTEIYLVHCKKHGFFEDIEHGGHEIGFRCPKCYGETTSVSDRANKRGGQK